MNLASKYLLIGFVLIGAFTNLIACGSQLYKASLKGDDTHPTTSGESNSEDPSSTEFGLHAPSGWVSLPVVYKSDRKLTALQLAALQAAMHTWEQAVGKTLFEYKGVHANVTGDSFPDLFTSLSDQVNGQYFDNKWAKTGKSNQVLATTIWTNPNNAYQLIDNADIHYNSDVYLITDALHNAPIDSREVVDMQSLATHELGHLIGLSHISESYDSSSIMNPSLIIGEGLATRSISVGDIKRVQKIYGCYGTACDAELTARAIMQTGEHYGLSKNKDDNQPSH
jgi:Matrixin